MNLGVDRKNRGLKLVNKKLDNRIGQLWIKNVWIIKKKIWSGDSLELDFLVALQLITKKNHEEKNDDYLEFPKKQNKKVRGSDELEEVVGG